MIETVKWKEVYALWDYGACGFPELLTAPIAAETVFVKYDREGYIYGFDWLSNENAQSRKKLIEKDSIGFLYFSHPSNKATIQTAEMLVDAQNEEEQAAIWIAATAKELSGNQYGAAIGRYARLLERAAWEFLAPRYYLWHHAMKRLVPDIMIPESVWENVTCEGVEPVIGLIQMNTIAVKKHMACAAIHLIKRRQFSRIQLS